LELQLKILVEKHEGSRERKIMAINRKSIEDEAKGLRQQYEKKK
jgi:hypothetical protein